MNMADYEMSPELRDRFEAEIEDALKRSRSKQYESLKQSGKLEAHLSQQAQLAANLMAPALEAGLDESAALEYAKPILHPESEKDDRQTELTENR